MRKLFVLALVGCGSSTPAPAPSTPPAPVPADAAIDAAPDAGISAELASAPAWVFRYSAPDRKETWTLRHHGDTAVVDVEGAKGTTRYTGTAQDGASLALMVASGSNMLKLDCKRQKQAIGSKCNDPKAKKLDVLDCYHPDFKSPMTFGPAPGVEYSTEPSCNGYRLIQ